MNDDVRLFTVSLVNRSEEATFSSSNKKSLFQSHLKVAVKAQRWMALILPYPFPPAREDHGATWAGDAVPKCPNFRNGTWVLS